MKMILFASALALGTAAVAQDATPAQTTPPTADSTATPQDATQATPPATDATTTPAATDQSTMPATPGDQGAMSNDAGSMSGTQQAAQSTDDSNLPMCSRTVTDKCKQGGSGMHHRAMRHHKRK